MAKRVKNRLADDILASLNEARDAAELVEVAGAAAAITMLQQAALPSTET